jgi:hypothetical protein
MPDLSRSPYEPNDGSDFIFFIGFNKCGTTSFHKLLTGSGIPSVHWRISPQESLARTMMSNLALGYRPFLQYEGYVGFSDLAFSDDTIYVEGCRLFREIHRYYPEAYFVLNTRDEDGWIRSRLAHQNGRIIGHVTAATGLSEDEVIDGWRAVFRRHHDEVESHFNDCPRYLRFDIETDDISDFAKLVEPNFTIDTTHWRKANRNRELARAVSAT